MTPEKSITVSKNGVVITVTFNYGINTPRAMRIASTFLSRMLDQFISKINILQPGYYKESASPQKRGAQAFINTHGEYDE